MQSSPSNNKGTPHGCERAQDVGDGQAALQAAATSEKKRGPQAVLNGKPIQPSTSMQTAYCAKALNQ